MYPIKMLWIAMEIFLFVLSHLVYVLLDFILRSQFRSFELSMVRKDSTDRMKIIDEFFYFEVSCDQNVMKVFWIDIY